MTKLMPRQPVPPLQLSTLQGAAWRLNDPKPANFTLVVVYRGLHCPVCGGYLKDLDGKVGAFAERGVAVVAASTDDEARARTAADKWQLENLTLGYSLDPATAAAWGLYFSAGIGKTSIGVEEPEMFAEPGLFLVRPDGTLYFASVQTMPFARPAFGDVLKALDFVLAKGYPARGELPAPV
ncbi:MAG: peroxiredoxin-like family protein [Pseudomonadota bacterium]